MRSGSQIALLALVGLGFFGYATRAWQKSNLFDHSYYFPVPNEPAAERLGGKRCGGLIATIDFRPPSKTKDV